METFDAIVVGLGAHGSATAATLARSGLRVLGLERFGRGELLGSSSGRSRMIRLALFEDPLYVSLAQASWRAWRELEVETGLTILTETSGLYAGPAGSPIVEGSIRSAREHGLAHEVIDVTELRRRWPIFAPSDDTTAVVERQAGILRADLAIEGHLRVAERHGATLRFGSRVVDWRPAAGGGVEVQTADGRTAGGAHLALTVGPWTTELVPDRHLPLAVEREAVAWFTPVVDPATVSVPGFPVWILATPEHGAFYGFPHDPELGLKVARHHSGVMVDPETVDRTLGAADEARIRSFIRAHLPGADGPLQASTICLYTNTPDERFVIDRHPAAAGIAFATACSGHGFKYAPVIGAILADLATTGDTTWPIEAFRADRFGAGPMDPGMPQRSGASSGSVV